MLREQLDATVYLEHPLLGPLQCLEPEHDSDGGQLGWRWMRAYLGWIVHHACLRLDACCEADVLVR